jgi:hypothetical protein
VSDEQHKLRMKARSSQGTLVPMSVAASLAYFHLHRSFHVSEASGLNRALDDAAMALIQIADLYYCTPEGKRILRLPDDELQGGRFEGGAKAFKDAHGRIYEGLFMRRIEVMDALAILEKARDAIESVRNAALKQGETPP